MLRPARIAILDPFAGISGDMLLGALLDVGVSPSWLETLPQRLGFPRVSVEVRQVVRCGVRATKVDFRIPEGRSSLGHHGAHVGQLMEVVRQGQGAEPVKQGRGGGGGRGQNAEASRPRPPPRRFCWKAWTWREADR